jgi:hypothetical protein
MERKGNKREKTILKRVKKGLLRADEMGFVFFG